MTVKRKKKEALKMEIGKRVENLMEITKVFNYTFVDEEVLSISEEIDELINSYYNIS